MYDGGVREKTLREELESLDLDQHDRDRILRKYESEKAQEAERNYCDLKNLRDTVDTQRVEIRALAGYIAMKDL